MDSILELVGRCTEAPAISRPGLLRHNRNRAVQASLSIEGNTLSLKDVAAIASGMRPMSAKPREVLEVENALALYEQASQFNVYSRDDLLRAHGLLMRGLIDHAGHFRSGGVGIRRGRNIVHVAPPAKRVAGLMDDLLAFLQNGQAHWLVRSCVFHYEFEFIHPFTDGNGRMGRFWQTVFLARMRPLLGMIPIEALLKERQQGYYEMLEAADRSGDSTVFVEFMLAAIHDALAGAVPQLMVRARPEDRLQLAVQRYPEEWFDRLAYVALFANLAPLTASRDLSLGVAKGLLERSGQLRNSRYRTVRKRS